MSILLDSLRKSEAQRNVGDAPTIYSTQDYGGGGGSDKRWVGWLLMGLAAVAITWFGWQQYSFPGADGEQVQTDGQPSSTAAQTASTSPQPSPVEQPDAGQVTRTPVEQLSQSSDSSDSAADTSDAADTGSALDRIVAYEADPESLAQVEESADSEDLPPLEVEQEVSVEDLEELVRAEQEPLSDRPFGTRTSREEREEVNEDQPMSYWQLPQGLRNELPEFKITVLVYAEEPEDRFLLMEGERVVESDELESGVTLEEIRRDGAVFTYDSWRFLVRN